MGSKENAFELQFCGIRIFNNYVPKKIMKSGRAPIVFWRDGSKTVVKRAEDEPDNDYNAFCAAVAKKALGSTSKVRKVVEKKTEVKKPKNDNN